MPATTSIRNPLPPREGFAVGRGGVKLFYRVTGAGPALVCCNGIGVSTFFWDPLVAALSDSFLLVQWDYRAHGKSDRLAVPEDISVSICADDQVAVLDAVGVDRAVLLGHSMGTQVNFDVYRRYRDRVRALVPTLGPYRRAIETFFDTNLSLRVFQAVRPIGARFPGVAMRALTPLIRSRLTEVLARRLGIVHAARCPHEMMVQYLDHITTLDLRSYFALAADMQRHDATDVLSQIAVPTLVVAGDRDLFCPVWVARQMADLIPEAELLVIPEGTHAALCEQPELLSARVRDFLGRRVFRAQ